MKRFVLSLLLLSVLVSAEEFKVNLTIDPDFPDVRVASVSIFSPPGFFFEKFVSYIDAKMEIRTGTGQTLPLDVKKGETYKIEGMVYGDMGWVILNFALLECKKVKKPGDYYIGDIIGTKQKWPGIAKKQSINTQELAFPQDWVGVYKGELTRHTTNGIIGTVKMELHIQPTNDPNTYTWTIVYDNQARNYELKIQDQHKGIYVIDEKNSIMLYSFFVNGTLMTHFGAQFGYLLTTYKLEGNQLLFQVATSNPRAYQTSGGQGNIPVVHSFEIREWQQAKLTKAE